MLSTKALVGTMLGTITLQQVIGQGELGAVFLAQQSQPHRQVAVKILAPAIAQTPSQRTAFLERFHQEIKTLTSLQHQYILPIYDYGEYDGHAYLVIPYINGGTLQHAIEQEGPLNLSKAANYLQQMAAALDYTHKQGIIHRNVKPTNALITPDGQVLFTDFGMMKIVAERQTTQRRLLRAGTPIGTPDYMAPEQVMGDVIDARTDIYALGITLYQMVTGKLPFQGETPMQIATQIVQMSLPSPRLVRTDLPEAAEQVILQATAKRPQDRYTSAQDFASAFHAALAPAREVLHYREDNEPRSSLAPAPSPISIPLAMPRKRGLFDPVWQEATSEVVPAVNAIGERNQTSLPWGQASTTAGSSDLKKSKPTRLLPAAHAFSAPIEESRPAAGELRQNKSSGLLSSMRKTQFQPAAETPVTQPSLPSTAPGQMSPAPPSQPVPNDAGVTSSLPVLASERSDLYAPSTPNPVSPFPTTNTTGALMVPGSESGTVKLTGAVKVVQVPVAGQPGRYITGFLPVLPQKLQPEEALEFPKSVMGTTIKVSKKLLMRSVLAFLLMLVLSGSGIFVYVRTHPNLPAKIGVRNENVTPNWQAIFAAEATATANANVILTDSLTQNIHGWPIASSGSKIYMFENGAYHITNNDPHQVAPALLPGEVIQGPLAYTLTTQEIKGDDNSINNSFGMMLRFSTQTQGGKSVATFYSFEVLNTKNGEYQFSKYDNSRGPSANPWTMIWHHAFGKEFHQGHAPNSINTFKVITYEKSFTFIVNGQIIKTTQDGSFASGEVGMLVNLQGTEVAFSHLILTYN